jgi:CRP-like cAMP-binding protein
VSADTLAEVLARADAASLPERALVSEAGDPIPHVHVPMTGLVSIVALSREGEAVEVAPVGCDGMVGLAVFLDGGTDPLEAFVQVGPVDAVRVPTPAFQELVHGHADLDRVMRRYVQWTWSSLARRVLCARLHPLEERLGHWLLLCQGRLGQQQFPMAHEYLGQTLGVRRGSMTIAAGVLRQSGLIDYRRGSVTMLDRDRLQEAACACHRVIAEEYRRLIGRGTEASHVDGGLPDKEVTLGGFGFRG